MAQKADGPFTFIHCECDLNLGKPDVTLVFFVPDRTGQGKTGQSTLTVVPSSLVRVGAFATISQALQADGPVA